MKRIATYQILALAVAFSMCIAGCQMIGDIFSAGVWVGIIIVIVVIGVLIAAFSRGKNS
jgi:hypothetical protein